MASGETPHEFRYLKFLLDSGRIQCETGFTTEQTPLSQILGSEESKKPSYNTLFDEDGTAYVTNGQTTLQVGSNVPQEMYDSCRQQAEGLFARNRENLEWQEKVKKKTAERVFNELNPARQHRRFRIP